MLAEIIIYITLFAALFTGAFNAAFQSMDAVRDLESKKEMLVEQYYLTLRLDAFVRSVLDWTKLSESSVLGAVSGGNLSVKFVSMQTIETATSSNRVMLLTLKINDLPKTFAYVQDK